MCRREGLDKPISHSDGTVSFSLLDCVVSLVPMVWTRTEYKELLRKISVEHGE
jgi:hypothetical protein